MFEEVLMIAGLLLASYGLASLLASLVLWFTAPIQGKPYLLLIPLRPDESAFSSIASIKERLNNNGLHRSTVLMAVDCGLDETKHKAAQDCCRCAGIRLCSLEELQEYLQNSSLQIEENTV